MIVREVNIGDELSVTDLWLRNGLLSHSSANDLTWLWKDNPVCQSSWPWGWVLEENGRIFGYIGNLPLRYYYRGNAVTVACARGYVVDSVARRYSLKLALAFFLQGTADLLLISSANKSSANVYKMFKALPIPDKNYSDSLVWLLNGYGVTRFLFFRYLIQKKSNLSPLVVNGLSMLFSPFLNLFLLARGLGYRGVNAGWPGNIVLMRPDDIDERWDELFEIRKHQLPGVLLADRSSAVMKWHYNVAGSSENDTIIFTAILRSRMVGYLFVSAHGSSPADKGRYRISDIFVLDDNPEVIDALLDKVFSYAKDCQWSILETVGFPPYVRKQLLARRPFVRCPDTSLFWYHTAEVELSEVLANTSGWYATPYDGDSSL